MAGWLISLRNLVAEATPLRRTMLVLLVLLPLVALGVAYLWSNPPVYRVLFTQLSARAGGEVITALEQLGLPYRLSTTDGSIEVPAAQLHEARYRLAARGLPRSEEDVQDAAAETPRFGASSLEEQQRYQRRLELDLARSIQTLEPIALARVHLALPKASPFLREGPAATAAVLVRLHPGAQIDAVQVATIQALVAASVPRMKRSDVQVLDRRGMLLGGLAPEAGPSQRAALEQELARRVLAVLTPWLGADRVSVQVTAALEDDAREQASEGARNAMVAGRTTLPEPAARPSEGRIQRLGAIVILGFEAGADDLQRAERLAGEALGLVPTRGDTLKVYALPAAIRQPAASDADAPAATPSAARTPPVRLAANEARAPGWLSWSLAALALAVGVLGVIRWRRKRPQGAAELKMDDFDAMLAAARSRTLDDPRVTADVIKLWMRA